MEPTDIHFQLKEFIETVEKHTKDVEIDGQSTRMLLQFMTDEAFRQKFIPLIKRRMEKVKTEKGLSISKDQEIPFTLFGAHLRWYSYELVGGFQFCYGSSMIFSRITTDAWKKDHEDFLKYESSSRNDQILLDRLLYFESPTAPNAAIRTSYYGCVVENDHSFPHDFYFYDDGLIYALPFNGYQEYIEAMLVNAAVECWQYFYISPQELVKKNKGLNYMTTDLRMTTELVQNISVYEYNPNYSFDRLDLIFEYLQRVVRFLPEGFPTLNFDHQNEYLKELEKEIKRAKRE